MDEDDFDRFEFESMRQAWEEEQSQNDLPPYQRDGYAESMYERADMRRRRGNERPHLRHQNDQRVLPQERGLPRHVRAR